jgi:hypothetical protein
VSKSSKKKCFHFGTFPLWAGILPLKNYETYSLEVILSAFREFNIIFIISSQFDKKMPNFTKKMLEETKDNMVG